MRVFIATQNVEINSDEKTHIRQHTYALFSRVSDMVDSIKITLVDANGPKGGVDKVCTVVVMGSASKPIVVKDKQTTGSMAVNRALQRASFAYLRNIKRTKTSRRYLKPMLTDEEQ